MKRKKKVVVVEDEKNIAEAEKLILLKDFDVYIAYDGEAGFNLVKKIKPDLVILDIMLPKISGFDVCRKIRLDKEVKKTKIIMVTAKNQDKDEIRGMHIGADDYIMKPFEATELMHVVKQVLKQ